MRLRKSARDPIPLIRRLRARLSGFLGGLFATLLELAARFRLSGAVATLTAAAIHEWSPTVPASTRPRADAINVLVLSKSGHDADVRASLAQSPIFRIHSLSRVAIKAVARAFLPSDMDDNNYMARDAQVRSRQKAYRTFLEKVWADVNRRHEFQIVVTGNFGYYAERELAAALEALDVAFVAIHKENLKSPGRARFFTELYRDARGPFLGRRILVYNEIERSVQLDAEVANPEQVVVTGMPRLDGLHARRVSEDRSRPPRGRVLFFSFHPYVGLPIIWEDAMEGRRAHWWDRDRLAPEGWMGLWRSTHDALVDLAVSRPDLAVTLKVKNGRRDRDFFDAILAEYRSMPPNIEVTHHGDAAQMILAHDVVCGFNTTALLEGIAAGRPVVVPRFAEATLDPMKPFIVDLNGAVKEAHNPDELVDLLAELAWRQLPPQPELEPQAKAVLDSWTGNSDGAAGRRVVEAVLAALDPHATRSNWQASELVGKPIGGGTKKTSD